MPKVISIVINDNISDKEIFIMTSLLSILNSSDEETRKKIYSFVESTTDKFILGNPKDKFNSKFQEALDSGIKIITQESNEYKDEEYQEDNYPPYNDIESPNQQSGSIDLLKILHGIMSGKYRGDQSKIISKSQQTDDINDFFNPKNMTSPFNRVAQMKKYFDKGWKVENTEIDRI